MAYYVVWFDGTQKGKPDGLAKSDKDPPGKEISYNFMNLLGMSEEYDVNPDWGCIHTQQARKVLETLNLMRKQESFCDYTITAGSAKFAVHKAVLVASSKYFEAVFHSGMKENDSDTIHLEAVDAVGLRGAVDFMYKGEMDLNEDTVYSLIEAASYLQIMEMLEVNDRYLGAIVTSDNCVEVMKCAEMYNLRSARSRCMKYMIKDFNPMYEHKLCNNFTFEQLLEVFEHDNLNVKSELHLVEIVQDWMNMNENIEFDNDPQVEDCYDDTWLTFTVLVSRIRWALISETDFKENVDEGLKSVMYQIPECQELLDEAEVYRSSVHSQPFLQNSQSTPRNYSQHCQQSLVTCGNNEEFQVFNMKTNKRAADFASMEVLCIAM